MALDHRKIYPRLGMRNETVNQPDEDILSRLNFVAPNRANWPESSNATATYVRAGNSRNSADLD